MIQKLSLEIHIFFQESAHQFHLIYQYLELDYHSVYELLQKLQPGKDEEKPADKRLANYYMKNRNIHGHIGQQTKNRQPTYNKNQYTMHKKANSYTEPNCSLPGQL